jgi:hypothetical protein|tara:strand:- start:4415 stop:4594 length:180 start_codon:yes stop_codon:yes gene_type:complete
LKVLITVDYQLTAAKAEVYPYTPVYRGKEGCAVIKFIIIENGMPIASQGVTTKYHFNLK